MGKSSPSAPAPPDYAGAAVAQGAANLETAKAQGRMNNPNVVGPLGSQTVTWARRRLIKLATIKRLQAIQVSLNEVHNQR